MKIKEIHVKNFRSILDETLTFDDLTVLVGRNSSGKSSFLRALELFYNQAKATQLDFHNKTEEDISIEVVYFELNEREKDLFKGYLDSEELAVEQIISFDEPSKPKYYGKKRQNEDFANVRSYSRADEKISKYKEIQEKYLLPDIKSASKAEKEMAKWEKENKEECDRIRDDGRFFGFTGVGQGRLSKYTRYLLVPAVLDAQEEALEGRESNSIKELMNLAVKNIILQRQDVKDFTETTQIEYSKLYDKSNMSELRDLENNLSETLRGFVPDASIDLHWEKKDINLPPPVSEVRLLEDGHSSAVQSTGHGLQRALLFALLQHLVAAQALDTINSEDADNTKDTENSTNLDTSIPFDLVLAIEEPELYQHPARQRYIASILPKLACGEMQGVARNTQIAYTTHSPLFVDLDRFDQIRLVRKASSNTSARQTKVYFASMDKVVSILDEARNDNKKTTKFDKESLRARLGNIITPWGSEGFFADKIVLVEGPSDRAAILTSAKLNGYNFDEKGIVVIPCESKSSLDKPYAIFSSLGIPTYVIWDWDNNTNPKENKYLKNIIGLKNENSNKSIHDVGAYLETNLEGTIEEGLGAELYHELLREESKIYGLSVERARKKPIVIQRMLERASEKGSRCETLDKIVKKIVKLNDNAN